ncbi:hypothetical protein TYRP_011796 [Tyrophagus putrescentiae]|nr:hypothetical protein TYRP_011796 [Tyrophagus putrescentiae]
MEMRRAIRGSARGSAYHHRKLMEEVRRKYCLLPSGRRAQGQGPPSSASQGPSSSSSPPSSSSILDTPPFAHLEPVFSDLYLTSRVLPRARSLADHVAALRRQRPDYARLLPPGVLGPCTSASAFGSSASSSSASTSSKPKNTSYEALQQLAAKQLPPPPPPPPPSKTTTSSESRSSTAEAREFLAQASKRLTEAISSSSSSSTATDESEVEGGDADDDEAAADLSMVEVAGGSEGRNDNEGGNRGLRKKQQRQKLTERERMTAYEAANRLRIGEAAIQHVLTPSRRRETVALVGRVQQGLPFANHFYSEED